MSFQECIDSARAALGRAEWDAARQDLDRAESIASDDAQHALVALHRASIAVLRRDGSPDLRVFRENMVRRHSPRHVGLAGYYILIDALDRHATDELERYLPPFLDAVRELAEPFWDNLATEVVAAYGSLRGDHDTAIELQRATLADLDTYDGPDALLTRVVTTHNLAYSCLAAHRYEEALAYAQTSLALGEQLGRRDVLAHILLNAAFATICMNRVDEAEGYVGRAAELLAGTRYERYVHYLRGDIARRRGDFDLAADHFEHLKGLYPGIPDLPEMLIGMNLAPFLLPE
ncbi:MAG TPA: tetratricopeptide repeat protein [Thermoanaerobaculia bacterium]